MKLLYTILPHLSRRFKSAFPHVPIIPPLTTNYKGLTFFSECSIIISMAENPTAKPVTAIECAAWLQTLIGEQAMT